MAMANLNRFLPAWPDLSLEAQTFLAEEPVRFPREHRPIVGHEGSQPPHGIDTLMEYAPFNSKQEQTTAPFITIHTIEQFDKYLFGHALQLFQSPHNAATSIYS